MRLTLITPYRDRLNHLNNQLTWWKNSAASLFVEWIVVEVTAEPSDDLKQQLSQHQIRYLHLPCSGDFHKTKALNLGLAAASSPFATAFDVDLIPLEETLARHCQLAEQSPHLLVTGYRLMAPTETVDLGKGLARSLEQATLGPEDQPSALRKHLLNKERFGVMPLFSRDRLLNIGGWDDTYIGWGAEDQDLMERYLAPSDWGRSPTFCRCPELLYLHLHHGPAKGWNSEALTQRNRAHYYQSKRRRDG